MNALEKFACSSDELMHFLSNWVEPIDRKCEGNNDNQIKASYYIWARYSMSIRTLKHLCKIEFFPDLCVIARSCLEFSASLRAVLSDKNAADDYIEFEKHATSNYLRYLENKGEIEKTVRLREHLSELDAENPNDYKWKKWCARHSGITGLIEKYTPEASRLYNFLSDFAHGSVLAIRFFQNKSPSPDLLENLIGCVYSDYICSTKSFIDKVWGPIITDDSQRCKSEFDQVAGRFC